MTLVQSWKHLLASLGGAVPRLRLRPGVSVARLAAVESALGFDLPADYRAWIQIADGQEPGGLSVFPLCAWLAPLDEVVASRQSEHNAQPKRNDHCVLHPHGAHGSVHCRLPRHDRFAVAIADNGRVLCALRISKGQSSQVLAAFDDDHFVVLGESLETYFERVARLVERGELVPSPFADDGSEVLGTPKGETGLDLVRAEPEP